jgi:hypothetical protein
VTVIVKQRRSAIAGAADLVVVCDTCADTLVGPTSVRMNWRTLWHRGLNLGWQGPDHPMGPHICPGCVGPWTRSR